MERQPVGLHFWLALQTPIACAYRLGFGLHIVADHPVAAPIAYVLIALIGSATVCQGSRMDRFGWPLPLVQAIGVVILVCAPGHSLWVVAIPSLCFQLSLITAVFAVSSRKENS